MTFSLRSDEYSSSDCASSPRLSRVRFFRDSTGLGELRIESDITTESFVSEMASSLFSVTLTTALLGVPCDVCCLRPVFALCPAAAIFLGGFTLGGGGGEFGELPPPEELSLRELEREKPLLCELTEVTDTFRVRRTSVVVCCSSTADLSLSDRFDELSTCEDCRRFSRTFADEQRCAD